MPSEGHWATIKRRVDAVISVSDIVCQNARISRYQTGDEDPQRTLSSRHLPSRNALVQRTRIPFEVLDARGVQPDDIAPFLIDPVIWDEVGNQRASETALHFKPLAVLGREAVTVVLPTCLSLALREYVIGEIFDHGLEYAFDQMLINRFSVVLKDTPLLGGPRNAPVYWRKVGEHRVSNANLLCYP